MQTGLDNRIADLCLLSFILHEGRSPEKVIQEVFRLLKSGGEILIVEWKAELDSPGPPRTKRIPSEFLEQMLQNTGFSQFSYIDWSANSYVATGRKTKGY
jgi:ubiquinone/menaquinone biosynthesis C-methylase UbiE